MFAFRPVWLCLLSVAALAAKRRVEPEDFFKKNDRPRKVYRQIWLMSTSDHSACQISPPDAGESGMLWKRDSFAFAFFSRKDKHFQIWMARPDGSRQFLVVANNTNHVLPSTGQRLAWSPDGKYLAYVAADPFAETSGSRTGPLRRP